MAIEAAHYGETRTRLANDPIILGMAVSLLNHDRSELAHEDGTPRYDAMGAANDEYRRRGGQDGGHMGAVVEALLMVISEPEIRIAFESEAGLEMHGFFHRCQMQPGVELTHRGRRFKILAAPTVHPSHAEARDLGIPVDDANPLHEVRVQQL